jgi:hypothetical protein
MNFHKAGLLKEIFRYGAKKPGKKTCFRLGRRDEQGADANAMRRETDA